MSKNQQNTAILTSLLILWVGSVFGNGGPFVIKYPDGDPAAKGVLARLDPDLKPTIETRLKVVKENLDVTFKKDRMVGPEGSQPPLAAVSARYTIQNPTDEVITVDFGFPILRGVYMSPYGMSMQPDATVTLDQKRIGSTIISNSAIYGIIRQRARETIEKVVEADPTLKGLMTSVQKAKGKEARVTAQQALSAYLVDTEKWSKRDAVLMAEYAGLDIDNSKSGHIPPPDRGRSVWRSDRQMHELMRANLGPLAAIGEQKATQFFAQLAGCFDADAAAGYEAIFAAWGGDVQERSVDIATGKVRPREISVDEKMLKDANYRRTHSGDPAIYARVDYLDENAKITEAEKDACRTILKNLPVVFTFAPMNILHYQVTFKPNATQELTVAYQQYAYRDTRDPASYQLAYVVHPASFWEEFGPIHLEVMVPDGVRLQACEKAGIQEDDTAKKTENGRPDIYTGTVKEKTGEIYLAIDADSWNQKVLKQPVVQPPQSAKAQTAGKPLRK